MFNGQRVRRISPVGKEKVYGGKQLADVNFIATVVVALASSRQSRLQVGGVSSIVHLCYNFTCGIQPVYRDDNHAGF